MRPVLLSILSLLLLAAVPGAAPAQSAQPGVSAEATAVDAAADAAGPSSAAGDLAPRPRSLLPYWHVFAAFGLTWVLLLGYALWLGRRFGRLEQEVRRLGRAAE